MYLGVPVDEAKRDLDKVWGPDPVWYHFIIDTLAARGMSHECDACDWQERVRLIPYYLGVFIRRWCQTLKPPN